jgi:hypothetical protein
MGEDHTSEDFIAALQHAAATRYAADRVLDLWEEHPDLSISQLLAVLENDAHEALVSLKIDPAKPS